MAKQLEIGSLSKSTDSIGGAPLIDVNEIFEPQFKLKKNDTTKHLRASADNNMEIASKRLGLHLR